MDIEKVAVIGGSTVGAGIIYTISNFGFRVFFQELNDGLVKTCLDQVNGICPIIKGRPLVNHI